MRRHAFATLSARHRELPLEVTVSSSKGSWTLTVYPATYPSGCRDTNGYAIFLCGGDVNACSRLQPLVTLSTFEAEYRALSLAIQKVILLRQILGELVYPQQGATPIGEDNQASLFIATTYNTSNRTMHMMDFRLDFVRDAHRNGPVNILHLPNHEMLAHVFTKPVNNPQYEKKSPHLVFIVLVRY
jgi:hypothetical protein